MLKLQQSPNRISNYQAVTFVRFIYSDSSHQHTKLSFPALFIRIECVASASTDADATHLVRQKTLPTQYHHYQKPLKDGSSDSYLPQRQIRQHHFLSERRHIYCQIHACACTAICSHKTAQHQFRNRICRRQAIETATGKFHCFPER